MEFGDLLTKAKQALQSVGNSVATAAEPIVAAGQKAGKAFSSVIQTKAMAAIAACKRELNAATSLLPAVLSQRSDDKKRYEADLANSKPIMRWVPNMGWVPNYANWCGPYRTGASNSTPIVDGVDYACKLHDTRLKTATVGALSPSLAAAKANAMLSIDFFFQAYNTKNTLVGRVYARSAVSLFAGLAVLDLTGAAATSAANAVGTGVANAAAGVAAAVGAFDNAVSNAVSDIRCFMFGR